MPNETQTKDTQVTLATNETAQIAVISNWEYKDLTFWVQSLGAQNFTVRIFYADQKVYEHSVAAGPWIQPFLPPPGAQGVAPVVFPPAGRREHRDDSETFQGFQVILEVENTGSKADFRLWACWDTGQGG